MEKEKRIYTIATAHLDTVWNWDFEHVLDVCLPNTLHDNFRLFSQYPDYRFNFEGAYRYELFREYYPEDYETLKGYIADGRWNVTGSAWENGDVNVPSPEQMFRNILYGNRYFRQEFGKQSNDIYLPDCFGFGWALPSIAANAGLKGFSTQKLSWGSAYGIPFDIGRWEGPDGKKIFVSLDPKSYCTTFRKIRDSKELLPKLKKNEKKYDLPWTMGYHGVGDVGGAPKEESVKTLEAEMAQNDESDVKVLASSPTEFFNDLAALPQEEQDKLPGWNSELLMTNHGVGSYTSRAFSKRMNRKNEELGDMAEKAGVIASAVCGAKYPKTALDDAWKKTIAHTFHDDITGTSVERVYKRSWNDLVIAANRFAGAFEGASAEIVKNMDTSWTKGIAVVVANSLEQPRMEPVDLTVPAKGYRCVRVYDNQGKEVPSQVNYADESVIKLCFCATVDALGYKVYDVLYSFEPCRLNTGVRCGGNIIENYKYIVSVNQKGDICSVIDKTLGGRELLEKPIRFEINKYDGNKAYPAWELTKDEATGYPWEYAEKGEIEVEEQGPVRVTLRVKQTAGNSTFTYRVSLFAGGQWVSVQNEVEWRSFRRLLQNGFHLNAKAPQATFDLGLGVIRRRPATKKLYAVPAQKWADLTDQRGAFGVSIFSDSKYGWVFKDSHSLLLTVLHTPKYYYRADSVQGMMDMGLNRYGYALYAHKGDFTNGTQFYARAFHQPLTAFVTSRHPGSLESAFGFAQLNNPGVILRAMKKAEDSDEVIVRFNEGAGMHAGNTYFTLGTGILEAREVNTTEDPVGPAQVVDGNLVFDLEPFEVKTFALTLAPCKRAGIGSQQPLRLPYNLDMITFNKNRGDTYIPTLNVSVPGELFPQSIDCAGVHFETGMAWADNNALISAGQTLSVNGTRLYFIGASLYGDKTYTFHVDDKPVELKVQSVKERVGGWDLYNLAETAFIKGDRVAWVCTHTHENDKDNRGDELYFFLYALDIRGASTVTLPDDNGLMLLAATIVTDERDAALNRPLLPPMEKRPFDFTMSPKEKRRHNKQMKKTRKPLNQS